MDSAKQNLEVMKTALEAAIGDALTMIGQEKPIVKDLQAILPQIVRCRTRFLEAGDKLLEKMLKGKTDTVDISNHEVLQNAIYGKTEGIIIQIEDVIQELKHPSKPKEDDDIISLCGSMTRSQGHHRLPKLELPKFGGEARDWLTFWSAFKTVHDDESITSAVKFQYLMNCMVPGSVAQEIVASYPTTSENYQEAVSSLEERFGRADMLVEVYVRDLIGLILENAHKSPLSFSSLYVKLSSQLRALQSLGVTTAKYAAILLPMVESTLPEDILQTWQRNRPQIPVMDKDRTSEITLEEMMRFLKSEVEGSERIRLARQPFSSTNTTTRIRSTKAAVAAAASLVATEEKDKTACVFCGGRHPSDECRKATKMSLENRRKLVKEKHRCFTCLKAGHGSWKCKENVKCECCGKRHYAIVCSGKSEKSANSDGANSNDRSVDCCNQLRLPEVPLQTVLVKIQTGNKSKIVRAMMDNGSQRSYVLKSTAKELDLKSKGERDTTHLTFGGGKHTKHHYRYDIELATLDSRYTQTISVDDEANICAFIPEVNPGKWILELQKRGVFFTDQKYQHSSQDVEVLLGNDVYGRLLTGRKVDLNCGITALETVFGWTLSGEIPDDDFALSCHVRDVSLQDLWNLDIIGIREPLKEKSQDEMQQAAVDFFKQTVKQKKDGRYIVNLPWIEGHDPIPSYRGIAEKKLHNNKSRLEKLGVLQAYHEVFTTWELEGVIEKIESGTGHYLSHHGVLKPESQTTPVRPVFNASFKCKGSPSLNSCLEVGPNMLEEIPTIITRFRMGPVGVVSDIRKAFLQIEVAEEDRDFLRCLWYKDESFQEVQEYRHCRVVFGVSSSPFLLQATLDHHLSQSPTDLMKTADLLKKSFYVDNCCASLPSMEDALKFKEESIKLLESAKMDLRCWEIGPSSEKKNVPVLGLIWDLKADSLCIDLSKTFKKMLDKPITKRIILSVAYSIFDPIGVSCAFTIVPKMLLQETCKLKTGWDSPLPEELSSKFIAWMKQLPYLEKLSIPRSMATNQDKSTWELHIFTDASSSAYAGCIFLRSGVPGNITIQLVMARARVAPIKDGTIPRLELIGCLCGARLADKVKKMLEMPDIPSTFWSDSTTALAWIRNARTWGVFVSARVNEIRKLSNPDDWKHLPGKLNPADVPSRGSTVMTLIETTWWEGPTWLREEERYWPTSVENENKEEILRELKKSIVCHVNMEQVQLIQALNKRSDYFLIVRTLVHLLRWKSSRQSKNRNISVTLEEFASAEKKIWKLVQQNAFSGVADGRLKNLGVFVDHEGLIRLRTRLLPGKVMEDSCPIVLPAKDELVMKLIWKYHHLYSHAGVQTLQVLLREKFWIIHSRRTIQGAIRQCVKCKRYRAQPVKVPEGSLPADRTRMGPAFDVTGVDMAGPLHVKGKKKLYIAIFTCATYRAIHLELCSALTTEVFIAALRRFVARRGRPSTIYSDNGLNFVGCSNALKNVDWTKITDHASSFQIRWKFNPPTAAWWGGFWERMIGVVKQLLKSVLGSARVNHEELETLLCDVEAVVNSRPLTYVSEQPDELRALTPNDFIRNGGASFLPDVDAVERDHLVVRYRNIQHCREELRNRFQKEYLALLVSHGKSRKGRMVKVGDVVLVGSDMRKRIDWPMGLVVDVTPGNDGHVRRVLVKTAGGILPRPAQRLYHLEISMNDK